MKSMEAGEERLGDSTADPRVTILTLMAVLVGALGAVMAYVLVQLLRTKARSRFRRAPS